MFDQHYWMLWFEIVFFLWLVFLWCQLFVDVQQYLLFFSPVIGYFSCLYLVDLLQLGPVLYCHISLIKIFYEIFDQSYLTVCFKYFLYYCVFYQIQRGWTWNLCFSGIISSITGWSTILPEHILLLKIKE